MNVLRLDVSPCTLQEAWGRKAARTRSRVTFHDFVTTDLVSKAVIRKIAVSLPQSEDAVRTVLEKFAAFAREASSVICGATGAKFFSAEVKDKMNANVILAECGLPAGSVSRQFECATLEGICSPTRGWECIVPPVQAICVSVGNPCH